MAKNHSIEIDVSLGLDGIDRDFSTMERKAKNGVKGVVKAVDQITTAMAETGTGARGASQDYEKSTEEMEKSAKEAVESTEDLQKSVDNTSDSTDGLKESTEDLGKQSKETSKDQEELGDKTEETRKAVEKSQKTFISWGDIAKTAVKGVAVVAGTLFTAMGAGAGAATAFGTEYKQASNTIQASTGATKEEMEGLQDVMKNVYAGNFGEDMNEVGEAVATVKKNLGGTDKEIQKATESAFAFRDTFGYEIPESTRAASAIMKHFGGDAEHAYDLMAKGAQNGLDFSGELLDNIDEYSVQFAKAGLSAEDMFNIMAAGYEEGAWNLDKIGDAVKELNIRLVDGSDTTKEGLKAIGLNADDVAKKMAKGGDTARETYAKVVKSLAEMDDKQAQNIAGVNLFGTMWEDLGPDVIAQLATMEGAYDDVKGTMDEINKVKYDDAGAAMEALKRKAETALLLPISEDVLPAISSAADAAAGYINDLASAYDSNGINGLIEKAGDVFADIAANAAEEAPRMVEVAGDFVEQMVAGFKKNDKRLAKAGADAVKAIAGSAVKLLPKELQEPVEEAVDDIVDSLTGGGIRNGIKTFETMFKNGFKVVTNVTKTVLPPFVKAVDLAADNMDVLVPLVVAGATAFKAYKVVDGVTTSVKASAKAVEVLAAAEKSHTVAEVASTVAVKAKDLAVGVMTGKITLATAATAAWNAVLNLNPIAIFATALVAATAGVAAYYIATGDGAKATAQLSEEQQALKDRVNEQREAYEKLREERDKQFEKINTEFSNTQALADELETIVDKNGKIKEGYEERASVITGLLSKALGIEIQITDGVIEKYGDLKKSIDEVIVSKKAEAIQNAMQDSYAEAVNNRTQAYMGYAQAQKDVEETSEKLRAAQEKQKSIQEKLAAGVFDSREEYFEYMQALRDTNFDIETLTATQKDQKKTLSDAEQQYVDYVSTIENYEGIVGAIATGDAKKIESAMLLATNSFITAETGTKKSLEKQVDNMKANYMELRRAVKEGAPGVTQESVDQAKKLVDKSEKELAKFKKKAEKQGADGTKSYAEGMESQTPASESAARNVAEGAKKVLAAADMTKPGKNGGEEYSSGLSSKAGSSGAAGNVVAGAAKGAMAAVDMQNVGKGSGAQFSSGLASQEGSSRKSAVLIALAARAGATVDATDLGRNFGQGYINGIASKVAGAAAAGALIANAALESTRKKQNSNSPAKETDKLGGDYGAGYVKGIVRLTADAITVAGEMGKKSIRALREQMQPVTMDFNVNAMVRQAETVVNTRIASYVEPQKQTTTEDFSEEDYKIDYMLKEMREMRKIAGARKVTVCKWNDREMMRMIEEVAGT